MATITENEDGSITLELDDDAASGNLLLETMIREVDQTGLEWFPSLSSEPDLSAITRDIARGE